MHFPTGVFEDEAKSQLRSEKAKRKCHYYLPELQGSDSRKNYRALGFKMLQYLPVFYSNFSPLSQMILLSPGSCMERGALTLL